MSAGRRRLEDALQVGREIDSQKPSDSSLNGVTEIREVDFGDIVGVYSLNFSSDGKLLAVGCGNGAIQVYSVPNDKKHRPLKHGSYIGLPVMCVRFHPFNSERLLTGGSDGVLTSWDLENWCKDQSIDEKGNEICALDYSHDAKIFATAGKDKKVRVYDSLTLQTLVNFAGLNSPEVEMRESDFGHGKKVFALRFHPFDDNILLTGGWDKCLKVWDVRVDHVVRTIWGPYLCGDALDIHENSILTGSWVPQDALQIWDFASGDLVDTIPYPSSSNEEYLYCARFCSEEGVVAGGSGTKDVKVIRRDTKKVVGSISDCGKPVQSLDVCRTNLTIAVGGSGDSVKLAQVI